MPGFEVYDEQELNAVVEVFKEGGVLMAHGFAGSRSRYHVRELERECADYFGVSFCQAVTSGTSALKIALKAVGVGPGDVVVTQAFNFIATLEAIKDIGAIPKVINGDESLNMDAVELNKAIVEKKPKAVICVNMLGVICDINKIKDICKKHSIPLIEDACESIGAKYNGKYSGALTDIGVFSFDHGKMIAAGEGGMILTNNEKYFRYCYEYHDHGHENNPKFPKGRDTRTIYGFNYRMTELQGAIAKVQLNKLSSMLEENEKRARHLINLKNRTILHRPIPESCMPTHDAVMVRANGQTLEKIKVLLHELKFGTKNVPDAMEWHCAQYWDHILSPVERENIKKTKLMLDEYVAIPISLKRTEAEYKNLASRLEEI